MLFKLSRQCEFFVFCTDRASEQMDAHCLLCDDLGAYRSARSRWERPLWVTFSDRFVGQQFPAQCWICPGCVTTQWIDFEKLEPKYPKGWSYDSDRDCNRYIVELERLVRYKLTPRFGAAVVFRLGIEITAHRRP
jgi:hypothetical protein